MSETVAPQEDQLNLPPAWKAKLLPRRHVRPGKPLDIHPEASSRRRGKIKARDEKLREALARPENTADAAAGLAYLDGKPDARGAAVIAALLHDEASRHDSSALRHELHAWLQEFGPAFAVAAAVERLTTYAENAASHRTQAIEFRKIVSYTTEYPYLTMRELNHGGIAELRSLLASLTDAEHAEVVKAVAAHRDTASKRVAAMIVLPDEHDWTLEAAADFGKARRRYYGWADRALWHSASAPEEAAAAGFTDLANHYTDVDTVAALMGGLGSAALPILTESDDSDFGFTADVRKVIRRAIALIPEDDATAHLFARLDHPHMFEIAADHAARFPLRSLRVVARLAPQATAEQRNRLAAIASLADPALRSHLAEADRATLEGMLTAAGRVPEASLEDLPQLLVTPPWTIKRPKVKPVVIDGLEAPAPQLRWAAGEQETWATLQGDYDPDEGYWREFLQEAPPEPAGDFRFIMYVAHGPAERVESLVDQVDGTQNRYAHDLLRRLLGRFGDRGVQAVTDAAAADADFKEALDPILSVDAARVAADRLARLKSARPSAVRWFQRHGLDAVPLLVPDALSGDKSAAGKKRRQHAETALAHLAMHHDAAAIAARAEPYGPEAVSAVAALVGGDPLEPRAVKVPKPGAWANPIMLPQVLLKEGERSLPADSVRHLITVLALATPDYPYPGLAVVAEACDRASLARFSRALFAQWLSIGAPSADSWALTQLVHFAEDETVWTLAPQIREWPGQNQHKRAVIGLEVLGAIGTEEAMRAVQGIADRVKFKALKEEASRQISLIAAELGLTREQLADRLVPDFGLAEEAALVLDYGPRSFTVAFDEHLKPFIVDDTGKPRKALPKPGAKDDPEVAEDAYNRYAALKKELRTVAAEQVARLEAAMVNARTWNTDEFRRFFVDHALTRHLARRLVWLADIGGDRFGFRIAEDGSFGDVEDDAVDLPEDAVIRLAHPLHLGRKVDAWAEVLADYEILQPFDQLARPVMAFTEEELKTGRLTRFEDAKVDVGRVLGMTKRGWQRAAPEDAGVEPGLRHALPGGGFVSVALEPGVYVGSPGEFPEQTLTAVFLSMHETYWENEYQGGPAVPTNIDPVTASEVLAALSRLTGVV